ncbi:MAG TPA: polyketide synthase [Methylomusa anaerophila]|uniref:Polyketide synthase PksR n=1 Tax=Methylomusa anaerophila TaxID=1930071 RepID=A0A348AQV2_9FIRM|nr:polyketide synthase [Methylomusa anaerophila]BBB93450.1 polyketide synthase PksR [Methylomusa anaerophila]HML90300.1 polyketide synthase [Methylomusa anaerophila]
MDRKEILRALQAGEISPGQAEKKLKEITESSSAATGPAGAEPPAENPMTEAAVDFREVEPGIVQLTMQDRVNKNTFSYELVTGLFQAFESIQANPNYKAVVLTGYDSYFASGGTKEVLLDIYEGKMKFTDHNIYSLALDCKIPVIAAMQGHAIGAGWSMGMFCDLIVMSRESIYTSNYLKYGFTPGAGATLIFPEKIGISLTQEILYTGNNFYGSELQSKGIPFPVLPRKEVLPYALQLAKTLAEAPRETLIALKDLMVEPIREKLSLAFAREVQMHEKTFVNQPEVKERIQSLYGQSSENTDKQSLGLTIPGEKDLPKGPASSGQPIELKELKKKTVVFTGNTDVSLQNQVPQKSIAIIGMAGQFPKSKSMTELWNNLADGRDCISEIPATRWPLDLFYDPDPKAPGKTYCKYMGALEDVDKFDPLFFGISTTEAVVMDPQQRLFLESCWACIEDSGLNPLSLSGSRCGVFVGCAPSDYGHTMIMQGQELNSQVFTGGTNSILPARISYSLNLKGPCLAIDTACSASLVAIAEACDSLILQNSDLALAGGVNIMAGPYLHIQASKAGMLSPDGRCFSFDARANGFVPGEGVGVVLLKRLADAVRDGDPIYGVISGWGINHDGKTNGITAPSAKSQVFLEKDVYQRFGINPETITLLEAHGTGTKLGDSIEIDALAESFGSFTQKKNYCALGTVKSNIGHLLAASGVAGVIKILLSLQHRLIPPAINFEKLNEYVSLDNNPFYINTKLQPWETSAGIPRRAAVSSFGFNGTNAHLVIEEYIPAVDTADTTISMDMETNNPVLVVLSAKTEEQLKAYAKSMKSHAEAREDFNLTDLAYTLQTGREGMEYRLAFPADSRDMLIKVLGDFIDNSSPEVLTGQVKKSNGRKKLLELDEETKALLETWLQEKELKKVAEVWLKGINVDWNKLYAGTKPCRINLPAYPFARERYWAPKADSQPAVGTATDSAGSPATPATPAHHFGADAQLEKYQSETIGESHIAVESLQEELAASLAQALYKNRSDIDVDASFVDMGMDSMIVVNWVQAINNQYGTSIAATKVYDYPTLSEFIGFMEKELSNTDNKRRLKRKSFKLWPQFPELIHLNQSSQGRPVFWTHAGQGGVEVYQQIAQKIQRPFFGIQARGWMTDRSPLHGLQAMAAYYIHIMQSVQPEGPYDVGGYSMGGTLAYEITRQLQELGQTVDTIVMLDAIDPAEMKKSYESQKGLILQTVNVALLASIDKEPEKIAQTLIHRDEVNSNLNDEDYLEQLIELAAKRGLIKSKEQVYSQLQQNLKVRQAYKDDAYSVLPLPDPQAVTCHFFRNGSGLFLGEIEPYLSTAEDNILLDNVNYWAEWERQLPNFNRMDLDSPNHMMLLTEPKSLEAIVAFCEKLYS